MATEVTKRLRFFAKFDEEKGALMHKIILDILHVTCPVPEKLNESLQSKPKWEFVLYIHEAILEDEKELLPFLKAAQIWQDKTNKNTKDLVVASQEVYCLITMIQDDAIVKYPHLKSEIEQIKPKYF